MNPALAGRGWRRFFSFTIWQISARRGSPAVFQEKSTGNVKKIKHRQASGAPTRFKLLEIKHISTCPAFKKLFGF